MERSENTSTPQEVERLHRKGAQCGFANNEGDIYPSNRVGSNVIEGAINRSLEARAGGNSEELCTLAPIQDRVLCQGK